MLRLSHILLEEPIFVPRRIKERDEDYKRVIYRQIQEYIRNGTEGDIDLRNKPITSLPSNLRRVRGNLSIARTPLSSFPDNLTVDRDIFLSHNDNPIYFPDNLTVGRDFTIANTPIVSLPKNLKVERSLYMDSVPITSLPKNLELGGSLKLENVPITYLPSNITEIKGYLATVNTPIVSLPDNLTVKGSCSLKYNSNLTSLPRKLTVEGDLSIEYTPITSLPDNLEVSGFICMSGELPTYPKKFENKIVYNRTFLPLYYFLKKLPRLSVSFGKIKEQGKGIKLSYSEFITNFKNGTYGDSVPPFIQLPFQDTLTLGGKDIKEVVETFESTSEVFGIEWGDMYILLEDHYISSKLVVYIRFLIKGADKSGREFMLNVSSEHHRITLATSQKSINLSDITSNIDKSVYIRIMQYLFPSEDFEKSTRVNTLNIPPDITKGTHLVNWSGTRYVSLEFKRKGRTIKREGKGVKATYNELMKYLTMNQLGNTKTIEKGLGVKWGEMIMYNRHGSTNFSILGKNSKGEEYLYDNYGSGAGVLSWVYSQTEKDTISGVLNRINKNIPF